MSATWCHGLSDWRDLADLGDIHLHTTSLCCCTNLSPASSSLAAEIDLPVQFDNGLKSVTDVLDTADSYTLSLHSAHRALSEQPFMPVVTLPDIVLNRNGAIAYPINVPVMMKLS